MVKLEIDFFDETDTKAAHIILRQGGERGFKLPLVWLAEFIEGLETPYSKDRYCFWENYYVHNTKSSCTLSVSTKQEPLLQLDAGQRTKLLDHLKVQYANWL